MKVQLFKNLIKEAVREVLKEELTQILSENKTSPFQYITNSEPTAEPLRKTVPASSNSLSSIESILEATRQSMTRSDYSNIVGGSGVIQESNTGIGSFQNTSTSETYPTVGLDISNLDFVKKAAAVYNLSNKKT